jgi:hypothetical protein
VHLPGKPHVCRALDDDIVGGDAGGVEARPCRRLQLTQDRFGRRHRAGGVEPGRVRTDLLEGQRRGEKAERRGGAGGGRDQHLGDAQQARDLDRVRRAGAAERDHREAPRVLALLDDVDARRGGHVLGHHAVHAPGRLDGGKAEAGADRGERALGRPLVEPHAAAEKEFRVVIAEQQIGVGHGRLAAAAAIAHGSRIGTRRARPDAQQAVLGDRRDRAAAGADLDHVDDRQLQGQPGAALEAVHAGGLHHRRNLGAGRFDQRRLGRRAAHVERDHLGLAGGGAEEGGRERAAGRPAFEQQYRQGARDCGRDEASRRMHQPQRPAKAARRERPLELAQIAGHQRLHIGVGAGRRRALVLPQLGDHFRGQRDGDIGTLGAQHRRRLALVHRIAIGVQERDRDRLDTVGREGAGRPPHGLAIERNDDIAVAVDPLRDLQTPPPRHERVGKAQEEVVDVVALLGPDFEDVAEPGRAEEAEPGAAPLDQRVRDERRAVQDLADRRERHPRSLQQFGEAGERTLGRILRRREAFVEADRRLGRIEQDEIGECPADVEADTVPPCHRLAQFIADPSAA